MYGIKIMNFRNFLEISMSTFCYGEYGIGIKKSTFLYFSLHHADSRGRKKLILLIVYGPCLGFKKSFKSPKNEIFLILGPRQGAFGSSPPPKKKLLNNPAVWLLNTDYSFLYQKLADFYATFRA